MMTTLSEKHDILSRLNREDAAAIVALIDLKTEEDMDKVLNKLDTMTRSFDARLDSMEKSFDARLDSLEKSVDARLDSFEKSVNIRFNAIYWLIGIMTTIAVAAAKLL